MTTAHKLWHPPTHPDHAALVHLRAAAVGITRLVVVLRFHIRRLLLGLLLLLKRLWWQECTRTHTHARAGAGGISCASRLTMADVSFAVRFFFNALGGGGVHT